MSDLTQFDTRGPEFQTQRPARLPDNLYHGPPPDRNSRFGGVASGPSQALMDTLPEPWRSLVYASQRKANFIPAFGVVGTEPLLVRPSESRTYLLIQNTSAANQLIVGIGYQPGLVGTNITGLILAANGGNYEPSAIPQGDIWLLGSAAATGYVLYVAQG